MVSISFAQQQHTHELNLFPSRTRPENCLENLIPWHLTLQPSSANPFIFPKLQLHYGPCCDGLGGRVCFSMQRQEKREEEPEHTGGFRGPPKQFQCSVDISVHGIPTLAWKTTLVFPNCTFTGKRLAMECSCPGIPLNAISRCSESESAANLESVQQQSSRTVSSAALHWKGGEVQRAAGVSGMTARAWSRTQPQVEGAVVRVCGIGTDDMWHRPRRTRLRLILRLLSGLVSYD
eukprot:3713316-Rhodomonas_salina.1